MEYNLVTSVASEQNIFELICLLQIFLPCDGEHWIPQEMW